MDKFSTKQIIELYQMMGLKDPKFLSEKNVENLFKILKIEPIFNEDGIRQLTPYELLGVLPVFEKGKEKPIVFAIKNKAEKIGKLEGMGTSFIYQKSKIKEEKSVLQTLKERYRAAIFAGDEATADSCLKMIDEMTNGDSEEFRDSFYDYAKFYRKLKKQLLIDLFAHFFLIYIQNRSSIIKNGIIRKDRLYRAYREEVEEYSQDVTFNSDLDVVSFPQIAQDPVAFGLQNVRKVVIQDKEMNEVAEFKIEKEEIKVKTKGEKIATAEVADSKQSFAEIAKVKVSGFSKQVEQSKDSSEMQNVELQEDFESNGIFGGFFKSFVNKRNKPYKRMGLVPQKVHVDEQEEKIPFSKKEKVTPKFKEREIDI